MQQVTLQFTSILEMIDFEAIVSTIFHINRRDLTITGTFTEADIELAKAGFHAIIWVPNDQADEPMQ